MFVITDTFYNYSSWVVWYLIFELEVRLAWLGGSRCVFMKNEREPYSLACVVTCSFSSGRVTRANRVITFYARRRAQFVHCLEDRAIPAYVKRFFFSSFTRALRVRCWLGNNVVKVAVTPKTTKCRLSHRMLQEATAKYHHGGPPAVIARHSSPRERRDVHRHYITQGDVPLALVRFALAAPPATFFVSFAIGPPRAHVRSFAPLLRWTHQEMLQQQHSSEWHRATRTYIDCEMYIDAHNDSLNYFNRLHIRFSLYFWNHFTQIVWILIVFNIYILTWFAVIFENYTLLSFSILFNVIFIITRTRYYNYFAIFA